MKRIAKTTVFILVCLLVFAHVNAQSPKKVMKAGKTQLKEYKYDDAVISFTEAIKTSPTLVEAYVLRAQCYEKLNKLQEAADDYAKASEMDPKNFQYCDNAGRLYYLLGKYNDAIHMLNRSISLNKGSLNAYLIKVNCLMQLKNYSEALATCDQALVIKKTALNYYNHGMVSEKLNNDKVAETDYRKSLLIDKKFKESYVGLANVLTRQNKTDDALKYCNQVIALYPSYTEAYILRSSINYKKSDLTTALIDIARAIELDPQNDKLYFTRAGYYYEMKQFQKAVDDYTKVLSLNSTQLVAFYNRASLYEEMGKTTDAVSDYNNFIKLAFNNPASAELVTKAKQKVYDLSSEAIKPEIALDSPVVNTNGAIEVALNAKKVHLKGIVKDQSNIEYVKVNDKEVSIDPNSNNVSISQEIILADADKITISVSDVYHNKSTITYKIVRTEIDPPVIDIITPYTSDYFEVFLDSEAPTVFLEGKIADESRIKAIYVDTFEAKFLSEQQNPNFSIQLNIAGKDNIKVKAIDIFGNTTERTYKLNRESAKILAENPMGKTWVLFINNSNYESFASLDGPAKDITTMRAAFSKYDIHNFIEKKNMTKLQMEKFFSIELRDLVKNNKVNSLLVWYAGHGKFVNETGYWVPVDAKRDDEFTYFNVNSLKAAMQSYSNYITHVLVITDACESGPSFYAAMRSGAKKRECGNYEATKFKSSQVFSSAGYELAADNSQFTKTFAKSLDYNTNSCIAIDNIVITVIESVGQGSKQAPKFGKIQGLEDEDGTFFFMKKVK
jgi:tetratricopeptide (TPR) repeat protein